MLGKSNSFFKKILTPNFHHGNNISQCNYVPVNHVVMLILGAIQWAKYFNTSHLIIFFHQKKPYLKSLYRHSQLSSTVIKSCCMYRSEIYCDTAVSHPAKSSCPCFLSCSWSTALLVESFIKLLPAKAFGLFSYSSSVFSFI